VAIHRSPPRRNLSLFVASLLVVVGSLGMARAASLDLSSTGVVVKDRTYGSALTCTLSAVADTYIRSDQTGNSFGSQATLDLNAQGSAIRRSFVRFDLSACSPAISSDAIVHAATVRLTTAALASTSARTYSLYRATGAWTESTTWASQPSVAATATASLTVPALTLVGTNFQWSVGRDVQAFVAADQTNLGWRLNDANEGGLLSLTTQFNSREAASNRPQLQITYAP
jgi:hypothetical protein